MLIMVEDPIQKKMFMILCSIIAVFSLSQLVFAATTRQKLVSVESFSSESEARRNKCEILALKDTKWKSAILQKREGQRLILTIYDRNDKGEFIKSDQICIPDWYGRDKVEYRDLLGDGKRFIFIEFEGNTGLGTLQTVLLAIGWHKDRFVPVLFETTYYKLDELFDSTTRLVMNYVIKNAKTPNVAIDLKYRYFAADNKFPFKFEAEWNEKLVWSNQSYSFYSEVSERKKVLNEEMNKFWNVPFAVTNNIVNVRSRVKDLNVNDLCEDFLDKSGIMGIMSKSQEEPTELGPKEEKTEGEANGIRSQHRTRFEIY